MPTGQPNGQRITWDDRMDKALLLSIIQLGTHTLPKMEDVVANMGGGLTAKAAGLRFSKLKAQLKEGAGGASPTMIQVQRSGGVGAGGKRKASKAVSGESGSEDEEEVKKTSAKKIKKEVSLGEEDEDDDERL